MTECVSKQVFDDEKCLEEFYIDELNKSPVPIKFHIPGYQRGYRWTTKNYYENNDKPGEIETLLQDLLEFANSSLGDEKLAWNNYCLQPIVLQKINNKGEYLVVDGQQRLTTLAIISHVLLNSGQTWNLGWDIVYDCEDQKKLSQCLLTPEVSSQAGKINDYFRNQALMAIEDWFKEEVKDIGQEQDRRKIIQPLFDGTSGDKHILLIKYMLPPASNAQAKGEEPGHASFKRLNSSKIPLTSGELIKAMFMAPNNGLNQNEKMEIAKEWELIESTLQNAEYWNMFHVGGSGLLGTQTRIELLFILVADLTKKEMSQSIHDERLLFRKIEEKVKSTDKIEPARELRARWSDVLKAYWWIESCYSDIETYNLLGWLSLFRENMPQTIYNTIWGKIAECDHEAFNRALKVQIAIDSLINTLFGVSFPASPDTEQESLNSVKEKMRTTGIYRSDVNYLFQNFFVLLNVQACTNSHIRFNFSDYRRIHQYGYRPPDDGMPIRGWDVEHIKPRCACSADDPKTNSLCNLMLLDATTNRKYPYCQYKTYADKRSFIINERLDHPGYFMLPCSQKAFLKCYTTEASCATTWNDIDGDNYFEALWKLLMNYLNITQGA